MATNLTSDHLRSILHYNHETGVFIWLERSREHFSTLCSYRSWNARYAGTVAGHQKHNGYFNIRIGAHTYKAHRLAWLYMTGEWPKEQIDHIDGNPSNNCLSNLREATNRENARNRGTQSNNSSGRKGVSWHKPLGKWRVQIETGARKRHLGYFDADKLDDAAAEYDRAAREQHGEFARTNQEGLEDVA